MKKDINKLPQLLSNIIEFLKTNTFSLSKTSRDGRINSVFNENEILNLIEQKFNITRPNVRNWMDFSFEENGNFIPVNIKVSTTETTDNLNCKLGIYYALTGKIPSFGNEIPWKKYFENLSSDMTENDKDYYFLIINKNNTNEVFATSLKSLKSIKPNGNNLPFQAKWVDNKIMENRSYEEAKRFLLSCFGKSLEKMAEAYQYFQTYFNEFYDSRFDFYIQCDNCRAKNHCYITNTINGKIVTHCRCNNNES